MYPLLAEICSKQLQKQPTLVSPPLQSSVMGKFMVEIFLLGFLIQVIAAYAVDVKQVNIWPMPKSAVYGYSSLYLSKDFELKTEGSKYPDPSGILMDGFSRFIAIVKREHVLVNNFSHFDPSKILHGIHVAVTLRDDELQYGINESYNLSIPANGNPAYAHLEAQTVYGALHGLQTFSQVCHFNFSSRAVEVRQVPWTIHDQPRFSYRGLLLDTARHYQPLPMIKKVIDTMAYTKLNVLHWHIVDEESFPLEIPSYPKLWDGAYSSDERYTMADAAEIVSYAQRRGINVLAELDVPGHARSWGVGYPSLWPSQTCKEPLDVSNAFTFQLIDGILSDFSKIFRYKFVHLGGDEVNTSCWRTTPHISKWLKQQGMNESEAYQYFVLRAQKIALSYGYEVVNWEETFINFGSKLSPNTVVHNWFRGDIPQRVVAAGLRCIVSNQGMWYLDHSHTPWQVFYAYEPHTNITSPKQQKLVIGGEVCTWGERIDGSNIEQMIWPRAAAAAERLWTPYDQLTKDLKRVTPRLAQFRCLLNQRGVAAAPLSGFEIFEYDAPGSCYVQ